MPRDPSTGYPLIACSPHPPVLQYLFLVLAQTPYLVVAVGQLMLLTLAYGGGSLSSTGLGTGWLVLLWIPIYCAGRLVLAALAVAITWVLLPWGLRPGECGRRRCSLLVGHLVELAQLPAARLA